MSSPGDGRPPDERDRPQPPVQSPRGQAPPDQAPHGGPPSGQAPPDQAPHGAPPPGPAQYGPPSAPAAYGQPPYAGAPAQPPYADPSGNPPVQSPYGGGPTQPPYVYNPYGDFTYPSSYPSPAGLGPDATLPPKRPALLHLALVLVVVSALPYLLVGLVAVLGAGQAATALPPEDLAQLQQLGIDIAQVVRITGVLILAAALVYVLLAVLAWTGRRWARGLLAAMTAGFVLMAAAAVAGSGLALDAGSILILAVPLILALAGVGLMFGGAARDWFARRR